MNDSRAMQAPSAPYPSGATSVVDSIVFGRSFGTPAMRAVFSDRAFIARCIEVEVALARAEAACGVIPAEAAAVIEREARLDRIDFERLGRETELVGFPIVPLLHQLTECAGDAGRYIHWGATTQDIMDTATVLQVRAALDIVEADLRELRRILAELAVRHRDTPMAGRTHLQQALPVTFGYKVAIWLAMFDRHQQRLAQLRPRVQVVSLAGAVGTLASLGSQGFAVQQALATELHLDIPATSWHVARDAFAETVNLLALITGSLGKVAVDVMIMASTEFGELSEPFVNGRGASSTMPQKRNPIASELMLAAAKVVRQHAGLMVDAMIHDFERATGPWQAEWVALPESFVYASGALHQARFALAGLVVDAGRMRENLGISQGLIVAEAVMMGLAPILGRQQAHDLVYDACRSVNTHGGTLAEALSAMPAVGQHFDHAAIEVLTDPINYLGLAPQMVDRAVALSAHVQQ
jgi:3-carboxy-cis,cis-muconate cycloisomerase